VRVLRLHGVGDVRLHEEPDPQPQAGELLLAIDAVGLCGSDRHWFTEGAIGDAGLSRPLVLGHEFTATIAAGARAGERVAVDPAIACGACEQCLAGNAHLCLRMRFAGHGVTDGGLRSLMAWPEHLLYTLPDSVSDAEGALLEPLGVALHALDLGHVRAATAVGVFGCGPIGLLLVQLLALTAATVIASDPLPHRRAAAAQMGATVVVEGGADVPHDSVDVAFEVAGTDEAVEDSLLAMRPGGRVVLVGIPDGDRTSFPAALARRKATSMMLCRRMTPEDLPRAIALARDGRVRLEGLVSETHGLTDGAAAFESLVDRRGLKVVVAPQRV
jgi:L-iditol 2-dehydrogenase